MQVDNKKISTNKNKLKSKANIYGTKDIQKKILNPHPKKKSDAINNPKRKPIKTVSKVGKITSHKNENISRINIHNDYDKEYKWNQEQQMIIQYSFFAQLKKKNWDKCVCKLKIKKNNKELFGTGFFCEIISKEIKVLITNNHLIDKDILDKKGKIIYFINNDGRDEQKELNLKLNRFTYTGSQGDFTIIEIIDEDHIEHFFKLEDNYIEENELKDQDVFSLQYPLGKDLSFSSGKIMKMIRKIMNI